MSPDAHRSSTSGSQSGNLASPDGWSGKTAAGSPSRSPWRSDRTSSTAGCSGNTASRARSRHSDRKDRHSLERDDGDEEGRKSNEGGVPHGLGGLLRSSPIGCSNAWATVPLLKRAYFTSAPRPKARVHMRRSAAADHPRRPASLKAWRSGLRGRSRPDRLACCT